MITLKMITEPEETTHERIIYNGSLETSYSVSDFVNPESFSSVAHCSKGCARAYVVLNAGYVQAIVFGEYCAYSEQDALDEAADKGKLDGLQCDEAELADYQVGTSDDGFPEYEGIINLGNAGEPFASESLDLWILPMSAFAEDPALMTIARVQARLESLYDEAEHAHRSVSASDSQWHDLYKRAEALADAQTICRFTAAR